LSSFVKKGSHVSLEKRIGEKTLRTVVPMHATLAQGTLSDILKQAALTVDELIDIL
jgi:predicted RNA binding protein YcfA (HicA-like mRNA interferase family)